MPYFSAISGRIQSNFVCAGSFPAFLIAQEMQKIPSEYEPVELKFNDIDIYYGSFGDGELVRIKCSWTKIEKIECEVNLILCERLNTDNLVRNFDINAVSVCVNVKVLDRKVSSIE